MPRPDAGCKKFQDYPEQSFSRGGARGDPVNQDLISDLAVQRCFNVTGELNEIQFIRLARKKSEMEEAKGNAMGNLFSHYIQSITLK